MIEAILELLRSIFTNGISWGALIAFFVALNRFQRANQYKHWNAAVKPFAKASPYSSTIVL